MPSVDRASIVIFKFQNWFSYSNRPIKGAGKVRGDSRDLKSPGCVEDCHRSVSSCVSYKYQEPLIDELPLVSREKFHVFFPLLLTPGNDRVVTPHSIDQSNQLHSRALRSIEHERVRDFHSVLLSTTIQLIT